MSRKPKFKSDAFEAVHGAAADMLRTGTIDKTTMRRFDESCLAAPPPIEPVQIKRLREANNVSQPVFARYLNTSASTVEKWETGAKKPSGVALKLLSLVQKHGLQHLT
ncbi:helix-turn-helix domain-containing protein [Rhodoblastus sp.]|jgi:putative transcriptional regulator|uniref:helix-turn-helix domain-containing protein n=1 Tax=Rhodoblastus sp. TaxID=1962975 RepID=UPI003F9D9399